jgi:hypothetical protein
MHFNRIILVIAIFFAAATTSNAKPWHGIVPLKSTRADVERLLGPSTGDSPTYYLPENAVYIQYSKCRCGDKCKDDDWNVAPGTVTLIRVEVKGLVKLADLKLDLTHFKRQPGDDDLRDHFYYVNRKEGFSIEVGRGYVGGYIYEPPVKDNYRRCPGYSKNKRKLKPNCLPIAFSVECSSEVIRPGDIVECRVRLSALPGDKPPTLKWTVTTGASLRSDSTDGVKVILTDRTLDKISVGVKVVSPNVCSDEASAELRVKPHR